ncbi:MAG: hypothetical protein ABH852_02365 [Methanobacteriota archaeon]
MKVELVKKSDNPLFKRTEVEFKVDHSGASTPKRIEVQAQLASVLGSSENLLVIYKLASTYGRQMASGIARVYDTRENLEKMEPKYLLKRGIQKEANEKKPAEAKQEQKAVEAKQEKKAVEAKQEKKAVEAKPEEKPAQEKPKEMKKEKAGEGEDGKES